MPPAPAFLARLAAGESPGGVVAGAARRRTRAGLAGRPGRGGARRPRRRAGQRARRARPPRRRPGRRRARPRSLGPGRHVRLTADQGPQARYTAWLKVLRGHVPVVVGTRAAAFAPVRDLGLVAWWDDGDDLHDEPRAPYPHVRDVLADAGPGSRAPRCCPAGFTRTAAVAALVESGELRDRSPARTRCAGVVPRVRWPARGSRSSATPPPRGAHLPSIAWRTAKEALEPGPVLVQVPRRGYLPSLVVPDLPHGRRAARTAPARWRSSSRRAEPACRWCGRGVGRLRLPGTAAAAAARRRSSAPGAPPRSSAAPSRACRCTRSGCRGGARPGGRDARAGHRHPGRRAGRRRRVCRRACCSTPGPASTARPCDAGEEALRRWLAAAALARAAPAGGQRGPVRGARPHHRSRWSRRWSAGTRPWFAARELADRRELGPARRRGRWPRSPVSAGAVEAALPTGRAAGRASSSSGRSRWPTTRGRACCCGAARPRRARPGRRRWRR